MLQHGTPTPQHTSPFPQLPLCKWWHLGPRAPDRAAKPAAMPRGTPTAALSCAPRQQLLSSASLPALGTKGPRAQLGRQLGEGRAWMSLRTLQLLAGEGTQPQG